ncbi:uncharacterized protein LOC130716252 [Lotus japonicus]|uniref:uncharacterized protein LOC130716252 n=1 Tax=Lotus japonicus TaxID=34305 RepID=UPI0025901C06|nr:uncharacterized protein LOC130716252 [Lotus japonicus]XP_057422443.1 uncharacterized protein LOC130716252 [Lotus japonicus]
MEKQKRKQAHQDTDASLSNSATNTNNQSESCSWECPPSSRKHFNSGSRMISTRRASAKRLAEIEKIPVSRCSQPRISREHCSATNVFQQPDDPVDTGISAIQVQAGSVAESPPRLLKQVADQPSTFTPEMGHEETEKVGNLIPKRLTEIEKTPVSRRSRPQISKEHCSASNAFQLPDDPVDTVISAIQVQTGSVVESPSRLLTQAADHSFNFTPEMRHEEAEKVGNIIATENDTVDIQEMEKAHEAGINSNHLNQMEWQETVLAECSPLKKSPLAKEFQVSNTLEEGANKNHSKSSSMYGSPSSYFSFNLTGIDNMLENEDEVDSVRQSSSMDTVEGYEVKPNLMPILSKILNKHGDIAENCVVLTMKYRSKLLEVICEIISELQDKEFGKIKDDNLREMIALVNEIKNLKVDIEWLHQRLVQILEARQILKQSGVLKEKKDSNIKDIETAEKELGEFKEQKKELEAKFRSICEKEIVCKESQATAKVKSTRIRATIKSAKYKVRRFLNCSLADDLL